MGSAMWRAGLRYRKQFPVEGKPDFAFPGPRVAVFCDSEFWHGYHWGDRRKNEFKRNRRFWIAKIERNMARDREVMAVLAEQGWTILRFWGHDIETDPGRCAGIIQKVVSSRLSVKPSRFG